MSNFLGTIHGGAVATIIEVATSAHVIMLTNSDHKFTSINLKVDFLKGIASEQMLYALSKVHKKGNKIWFMGCQLFNEKGELCYDGTHIKSLRQMNKKKNKIEQPKL